MASAAGHGFRAAWMALDGRRPGGGQRPQGLSLAPRIGPALRQRRNGQRARQLDAICNGCHSRGYHGRAVVPPPDDNEPPLKDRVRDAAVEAARESQQRMIEPRARSRSQAPERAQQLRAAVAQLDVRWARSAPARWVRERFMQFVMNPILDHYAARRATGFEKLRTSRAR